MQYAEPLRLHDIGQNIDPSHVSPRSVVTRHEAERYRIAADDEHNRDRRGGLFGGLGSWFASNRRNNCDLAGYEIGHNRRNPTIVSARPAKFHRHILAFDEASFVQASTKCFG